MIYLSENFVDLNCDLIFRLQLEGALGILSGAEAEKADLSLDKGSGGSDPSLESRAKEIAAKELKELNEEKRKSARRKE